MRLAGILILLGICLASCTSRRVTPNRESRRAIDTIYKNQVTMHQPVIDSMCKHLYDSMYTVSVDSILKVREEEMNVLVK